MDIDWENIYAAIYRPKSASLRGVLAIDPIRLNSLVGIDSQKNQLIENTQRFLSHKPANNALLWGARGTGKSSLIKAIFNEYKLQGLRLIEFFKDDLHNLPDVVDVIRDLPYRFVIYCDDFSFEANDNTYMALKTVLEGSIEQAPDNVLLYSTSNRRHLVPEYIQDNLATKVTRDELHYADIVEDKLSLSDRFGLWLSFYQGNLQDYFQIVDSYFPDFSADRTALHEAARQFSMMRGGTRSGRTAKQFYNYYSEQQ